VGVTLEFYESVDHGSEQLARGQEYSFWRLDGAVIFKSFEELIHDVVGVDFSV
jgi:hypothetical protein